MLKIIISPAKRMNICNDHFVEITTPVFIQRAKELQDILKGKTFEELQELWQCNEKIARLNVERLHNLHLYQNLTPALFSYEGIQYQYMAPYIFSDEEWDYVESHLSILSGFYGILKPSDGVIPYRLEMQTKLRAGSAGNLYDYWGDALAHELTGSDTSENITVLNLASAEYSKAILPYLDSSVKTITCTFGEYIDGRVRMKGTQVKMARGEMVRFMAEKQMHNIAEIQKFDRLGYHYSPSLSEDKNMVFIK